MMLLTRLTRARLDRSPAIVGGSPTSFPGGSSRPHLWGKLVLGLLPLALVLLLEADILRRRGVAGFVGTPDARFYVYQLHRMGELRGRWWELGSDALVGRPYPTAAAKHPGIYEGLDLLLPSAVTSRFLDPVANYLALLTLALACNGWVAALLAYRLTHSYRWSALAVVLITWNLSTGARMQAGHLHLLHFGWVLLAAYAYSRFLDAPTPRRGLLLGLAAALVLQSSFYFGYFLVLGLGLLALGEAIAGRLGRRHVASAMVATLTFALLGAALTFPVWTIARRAALVDQYFHRQGAETWKYGSDLVQYVLSPLIGKVYALFQRRRPNGFWESWHYPGLVILAAAGAVIVARLRGRALGGADPRLLERLVMLAAILVVLSLAGGPSVLLFRRRAELPVLRSGRHVGRGGRERGDAGHPGSLVGSLAVRPAPRRLLRRGLGFGASRRRGPRPGSPPRGGSLRGGRSTLGRLARQEALGRSACGLPGARVPKAWGCYRRSLELERPLLPAAARSPDTQRRRVRPARV